MDAKSFWDGSYVPVVDTRELEQFGLSDEDRQEATDAVYDCAHGRLAGDRTAVCGCWPQEPTHAQTP